jgi:hypothetical protein
MHDSETGSQSQDKATSSSKAYFLVPKEPEKSRFRRDAWPVAWVLCRYRHKGHYAVSWIMPHGRVRRPLRLLGAQAGKAAVQQATVL